MKNFIRFNRVITVAHVKLLAAISEFNIRALFSAPVASLLVQLPVIVTGKAREDIPGA